MYFPSGAAICHHSSRSIGAYGSDVNGIEKELKLSLATTSCTLESGISGISEKVNKTPEMTQSCSPNIH